jgi:hypothetical protein
MVDPMSNIKENHVTTEIAPCGLLCSKCHLYIAKICLGCYNENQRLDEKCAVTGEDPFEESLRLITCMNERDVNMCLECQDYGDCDTYEIMFIKCPFSKPEFQLEPGKTYLIKEKKPDFSFQVFSDWVKHGTHGLCITRQHPKNLKNKAYWDNVKIFWLTTIEGQDNINPTDIGIISKVISQFVSEHLSSVTILDGLELLYTHNDFPAVLRMVNHITEQVMQHNGRLIITVDERTLDPKELALLEKNIEILEPR